jgi:hypothetical protein
MNWGDRSPTWGLRWWRGYWYVHLMWMHWKTGQWCSSCSMTRQRYRSLERALKAFAGVNGVVMIFPV